MALRPLPFLLLLVLGKHSQQKPKQKKNKTKADDGAAVGRHSRKKLKRFREKFAALREEELFPLVHPVTLAEKRVTETAKKYIAGSSAASWVQRMNFCHHVAPPTSVLLERYKANLQAEGSDISAALSSSMVADHGRPGRYAKKWLQRFRKKWNLRVGKLSNETCIPATELRSKARKGVGSQTHEVDLFAGVGL